MLLMGLLLPHVSTQEGAARFPRVRPVVDRALPTFRKAVAGEAWPVFTDDLNDVEFRTFRVSFQRE